MRRKLYQYVHIPASLKEALASLGAIQAFNSLIPVLLIPFLVRTLGIESYGQVILAQSIASLLALLVNFGFDLSAPAEIARSRNDAATVNCYIFTTYLAKILLFLMALGIAYITYAFSGISHKVEGLIYVSALLSLFATCISPAWIFHGYEKLRAFAFASLGGQIISTLLVFTFVRQPESAFLYPLLFGAVSTIVSLWLVAKATHQFGLQFYWPRFAEVGRAYRASTGFFAARTLSLGLRHASVVVVGAYFSTQLLGLYSIAEKMFFLFSSMVGVIAQALYPYMARTRDLKLFWKIFKVVLTATFIAILLINMAAMPLTLLVSGGYNETLASLVRIFSLGFIFSALGTLFGFPLLGAFGHENIVNKTTLMGGLAFALGLAVALFLDSLTGVTLAVISGIAVPSVMRVIYARKQSLCFAN